MKVLHLAAAFVNMISGERDLLSSPRRRQWVRTSPATFPDSDYSPGLGQVLVEQEGPFQGTRFKVAKPYNYGQHSSSTGAASPAPLRHLFQWYDEEEEASGYASSTTISSVRTWLVSQYG